MTTAIFIQYMQPKLKFCNKILSHIFFFVSFGRSKIYLTQSIKVIKVLKQLYVYKFKKKHYL